MKSYYCASMTLTCLAFVLFFQGAPSRINKQDDDCYDKFRWKYEDYTSKPLVPNQLLTAAYTIYIDFASNKSLKPEEKNAISNIVKSGFHIAMMNWTSTLVHNRSELGPEIQKYISDHTFIDGNKAIWNSPQVLPVKCPQDANFVIKVFLPDGKKYPSKSLVAMAQVKGRTITLNMQNYNLIFKNGFFELNDDKGALNIVPVLAHELGHSFGLDHVSIENSIMNGSFYDIGRFPSLRDGKLLAGILLQKVLPSKPGYFNPTECAGLKFK